MIRWQRRGPALLVLLLAACAQAQPTVQAPAALPPQGVVVDAGQGQLSATLAMLAAPAYALQQAGVVHRWVPADVVRYDVELRQRNALNPDQFDAVGTGISVQVPVNAQGTGTATFASLRQGSYYRAYVKAMGKAGGATGQDAEVQMNAQATGDHTDFDFTAANDVVAQLSRTVSVNFDGVAFSGTGALAFGTPVPGNYLSPSEAPGAVVIPPPTPTPSPSPTPTPSPSPTPTPSPSPTPTPSPTQNPTPTPSVTPTPTPTPVPTKKPR